MIKVGCCGFPCARGAYFRRFPVVEVQQTFYQPPRLATLERWRREAPEDFAFTLKAWQVVTHPATSPTYRRLRAPLETPEEAGFFRRGETVRAAWERTRAAAAALAARTVLFQCPASFTPCDEHLADMRAFFRAAPRDGLTFAWEPRGRWPDALVAELCAELDLVHCVDPLARAPVTAGAAYFRLHGRTGYRYRYTDADLDEILERCAGFGETTCLFNNMTMGEDAARFQALVARARATC